MMKKKSYAIKMILDYSSMYNSDTGKAWLDSLSFERLTRVWRDLRDDNMSEHIY